MVPLFSVFSLLVRLFTRPLTNNLKVTIVTRPEHHPAVRQALIFLGQHYHRFTIRLQRQTARISGIDSYIKPLAEGKAIEAGADLIGEILAYGILISLGVYEMMRYQRVAKGKEQAQADTYARIHARIDGLHAEYEQLVAHLKERRLIPE